MTRRNGEKEFARKVAKAAKDFDGALRFEETRSGSRASREYGSME